MEFTQLTYRQNFEIHFNKLRQCPAEEVSRHIISILEIFPFSDVADRAFYAESVFQFAETQKEQKSLLYAYASFLKAFHHFYLEQYDKALPMLTETEKMFDEQKDLNGAALCIGVAGSIYRTMGIVDLSLKGMLAGHEQLKHIDTFQMFTMASGVTVASIYSDQKHYEEAIELFNKMLAMPEKHFKYYWDVYTLHGLAKIYLVQKQQEKALQCLQEALALAEKNNHSISLCNSKSELGNYYFQLGALEKAEAYYRQSLELREQYKFHSGAITSCIRLAEICIKQSRTDEALQFLIKGQRIAEEIKVKPKLYQIHRLLSEIYECKNDLGKSLFHFKEFQKLHDEVGAEENARKVKNVKAYFEAEQTKKENAIIKKQKEEIERKNIELQETIDELTRTRIGKKARAITLAIAVVLFIFEDIILHVALTLVNSENYFVSMAVKMTIIFSLAPINKAIEKYLLKKVIKKRKEALAPVPVV